MVMAPEKRTLYQFQVGQVAIYSGSLKFSMARPLVVFLHGALRRAADLARWVDLLSDVADVILVDLPGHGNSADLDPATVRSMAATIHDALLQMNPSRRVFLVGESIGGTVALAIGGLAEPSWLCGLFLADPPLTTGKLWNVANEFRLALAQQPDQPFLARFARDAFGISEDGIDDIRYYDLFEDLRTPALIAYGDAAAAPQIEPRSSTTVFDEANRVILERRYPEKVKTLQVTNCGHLLLVDAEDQCLELITEMLNL
jgi:pimeloyl-ACP methyl ester carboxylesterase